MGLRHTVFAFNRTDLKDFQRAIDFVASKLGGTFDTQHSPNAGHNNVLLAAQDENGIALVYSGKNQVSPFFRELSWKLGGACYLEARIQEGSLWDYSLYRGMQHLDQFSTHPLYWTEESDTLQLLYDQGRPEMLSVAFGVPVQKFERYMRYWYSDWDESAECFRTALKGKAYPEDQHSYGEYEQMWDFLRSLGITDPCNNLSRQLVWTLELPSAPPPKT